MSGVNLANWIQDNVVSLILLIIAVTVLWRGRSGNISAVVTIIGCGLCGLVWLALATTGAGAQIGEWVVSLVTA